MPREIILSPHAGFCFGVKRSVEMAYAAVSENADNLYMLGEIIHNDLVVNELINKGVKLIHSPGEIE
ncbi:MAG: 4-hydroxy-3-methylbut-2-enyl diphosphate reductase, partial [Clostridia bacterium]|nr:4-hydroxy-3-methylbut-2-enyl diphosphate reductase [Clostridia bacterium]